MEAVHSGTARFRGLGHTEVMQTELMKKIIVGGWVLGLGVLAISVNMTSVGAWTVLVGLGALPPLIMLKIWNPPGPARSMSQTIRDVIN